MGFGSLKKIRIKEPLGPHHFKNLMDIANFIRKFALYGHLFDFVSKIWKLWLYVRIGSLILKDLDYKF